MHLSKVLAASFLFLINRHLWLLDGHLGFDGNGFYFRSPGLFQGWGAVGSNSDGSCSWKPWPSPDLAGSARAWAKVTAHGHPQDTPTWSGSLVHQDKVLDKVSIRWLLSIRQYHVELLLSQWQKGCNSIFSTPQKPSLFKGTILDFITAIANKRSRTKSQVKKVCMLGMWACLPFLSANHSDVFVSIPQIYVLIHQTGSSWSV